MSTDKMKTCPDCGGPLIFCPYVCKKANQKTKKAAKELTKYFFYSDPSHGWLKVQRKELVELGIETQVSGYSYQKGDAVYLEEDRDASIFIDAWEAKNRIKLMNSQINFHIVDRASRIRTYQPFRPKG